MTNVTTNGYPIPNAVCFALVSLNVLGLVITGDTFFIIPFVLCCAISKYAFSYYEIIYIYVFDGLVRHSLCLVGHGFFTVLKGTEQSYKKFLHENHMYGPEQFFTAIKLADGMIIAIMPGSGDYNKLTTFLLLNDESRQYQLGYVDRGGNFKDKKYINFESAHDLLVSDYHSKYFGPPELLG